MQKLSFFAIIYIGDFMTFASRERFKERKYSYMKKKVLDEENPLLKLGKIIVFSPLLVFGTIGQIIDKNNNKKTINNATKNKINNNVDNNIIITKKNKEYIKENIMSTQEKKSNNNIETEVNNDLNKQSIIIVANDNECLLLEKKIYLKIKKKLDNLNQKIKQIESEEYLISKYADDKNLYNKAKKIQTRIEELQFELTKIEEEYKILSNKNIIKDPLKLDDSLIIDDIVNYRNHINELNYNKIPDKLTLLNTYTILNNKLEDLTNKTKELNKKKSLRVKELQNRDKKYNKAKIKTKNLNEIESDCNKIIEDYINYEKELLKKVNKIDSKTYTKYKLRGMDNFLSLSCHYIGLIALTPFKGIIPKISEQTKATRNMLNCILDNMHYEKINEVTYSANDYINEIDNKIYSITNVEDNLDKAYIEVNKLKEEFKRNFLCYNLDEYDKSYKKILLIEGCIIKNKEKIDNIKKNLNSTKKTNKEILTRVKKLNSQKKTLQ